MTRIYQLTKKSSRRWILEAILTLRALLFIGKKYTCPCCGWKLRAFTYGAKSMKIRHLGYCPRCNSKARHRRDWLFLENNTNLFSDPLRLLHVSPKFSLSRKFRKFKNINYVSVDITQRPNVNTKIDITAIATPSNTFDAIICIHVLEHILEDRQAIRELFRVLKPGGWALITVPIRLDQKTFEDPTIIDPQERKIAFGEFEHVRFYGHDLVERLGESGFHVQLYYGKIIGMDVREKYGYYPIKVPD